MDCIAAYIKYCIVECIVDCIVDHVVNSIVDSVEMQEILLCTVQLHNILQSTFYESVNIHIVQLQYAIYA